MKLIIIKSKKSNPKNKLKNFKTNQNIDEDFDVDNSTTHVDSDSFVSNDDSSQDIHVLNFNRFFEDYLTNRKSYV